MTPCKYKTCTTKAEIHGYCVEHAKKRNIRKHLTETPAKRVVIAGVDEGSNANGSHVARQVSVAREPWL